MKLFAFLLLLFFSSGVFAGEICTNYESKIEADHKWKESDFSKESADYAINRIQKAVNGEITLEWFEYPNLSTKIEGYLLRVQATQNPTAYNVDSFCQFLTSTPVAD